MSCTYSSAFEQPEVLPTASRAIAEKLVVVLAVTAPVKENDEDTLLSVVAGAPKQKPLA